MPAGASVRTGTEHTSVPAVTSRSASGGPSVTTWSGSRPGTASTVYCHTPAHSGPTRTVTPVAPLSTPLADSSAITRSGPGRPAHATAVDSANPLALGDDGTGTGTVIGGGAGREGDGDA